MYRVKENLFIIGGVLLPFVLFPFSPLFSFLISIIILIFYSPILNSYFRISLALIGVFSLVYIFASRLYIDELNNDLMVYYNTFLIVKNQKLSDILFSFKIFGGGIEFGIILCYKIYAIIFSKVTPFDLAINNSIICGIATILWFELYGKKRLNKKYWGMALAFILLFISMPTIGYLQRQALATIFILFALEMTKKRYFLFFTILACIFHITSLPIIIIWKYLLKKKLTLSFVLKSVFFLILMRLLFQFGILILINLGLHKALYYKELGFAVASYRFLVLIFLLVFINLLFFKHNLSKWKTSITVLGIFYLVFLGVPLLSERVNFIFLYLYGYFLFISVYKKELILTIFLALLYLFYFFLEKTNFIAMPVDAFWSRYPMFSFEPFYYIQ